MVETQQTNQEGLSLIEVMLGAVVVMVFVGALLTLTTRQGLHRKLNQESSLATTAALDTLEEIRNQDFSTLPSLHGTGFDVIGVNGDPGGLTPQNGDSDGLPGEIRVSVDSSSSGEVLYRVEAVVSWYGVSGNRTLKVDTLVSERK